ncbi:hypothetical protein ACI48J_00730 [Paenibacillus chitinolyticus]|uniref:hypothetical protein n=1 Tax=Paenibacillus chitinolyticus TaxID=79263 RepID=UPI0038648115
MKRQVFVLTSTLLLLVGCESTAEKMETAGTPVSSAATPLSGTGETSAPVTPSTGIAGTTAPTPKPAELPSVTPVSSIPAKPPTQEEKTASVRLADQSGTAAGEGSIYFDFETGDGFQFYLENKGDQSLYYRMKFSDNQNIVQKTELRPGESHSYMFRKNNSELPLKYGAYRVSLMNNDGSDIEYAVAAYALKP